eukprot:403366620
MTYSALHQSYHNYLYFHISKYFVYQLLRIRSNSEFHPVVTLTLEAYSAVVLRVRFFVLLAYQSQYIHRFEFDDDFPIFDEFLSLLNFMFIVEAADKVSILIFYQLIQIAVQTDLISTIQDDWNMRGQIVRTGTVEAGKQ